MAKPCGGASRRQFLAGIVAAGVSLSPAGALAGVIEERVRRLRFVNVRIGEAIDITYWHGGRYIPEALSQISFLLRDTLSGEIKPIDPRLVDLMYGVRRMLRSDAPYAVISGYRTPRTNRLLARRKRGVATNSLHMEGMAVDLLLPGKTLRSVAETARTFRCGGVGYYPRSNFVHLDIGPVRTWTARV